MPNEKAQQIIHEAMKDRKVYDKMAQRESAVWSNHFVNPEHKLIREHEQEATAILRPARHQLRLHKVLAELGVSLERGLSLGCGSGRAERMHLKLGVCKEFHGIDIAEDAVQEACRVASEEGLNCSYEVQDLNFVRLPEKSYDLIVAQTSMHHVLHLEHVFDQVAKSLRPGGFFWVHDYIGETQFQFSDERLQIMNDLLKLLPERLRVNHFNRHPVTSVVRRDPGQLVSPFECIRSGEIKELLLERFEIVVAHEETTFLDRVAGLGMAQNYIENEDTRVIYEVLLYFDQLLAKKNIIPPVMGQYLLRPKV